MINKVPIVKEVKLPWSSPSKKESNSDIVNPQKKSKYSEKNKREKATLLFEDKTYEFDSLPKEAKDLAKKIKASDEKIRFYKENLEYLALGRESILNQIRERLKSFKEL